MRCMSDGQETVAAGWNNAGALLPLSGLEPPWFHGYRRGGFTVEWQGQDELVLASDRLTSYKVGLPSMRVTFPYIAAEEIQILRGMEGKVTLKALDQDVMEWHTYNAVLRLPDAPGAGDRFTKREYTVTFLDLQLIS